MDPVVLAVQPVRAGKRTPSGRRRGTHGQLVRQPELSPAASSGRSARARDHLTSSLSAARPFGWAAVGRPAVGWAAVYQVGMPSGQAHDFGKPRWLGADAGAG